MCVTCGCDDGAEVTMTNPQTGAVELLSHPPATHSGEHQHVLVDGTVITHHHHDHSHQEDHHHPTTPHEHPHTHTHGSHAHAHAVQTDAQAAAPALTESPSHLHAQMHGTTVTLEQNILAKNDLIAAQNRGWLQGRQTLALNLVSSPGSGKTTLLTRTINDLQHQIPISVIEGDQSTANDAERIKATGCPVVQINTGTGCHLEASMVDKGLKALSPPLNSVVMIENVGNLVCPALFDLGESAKVVILSVTEGEDKPIKYPHMFRASSVMILTKIDLLPYVSFDVERCLSYAHQVNPDLKIFQLSATTGQGLKDWYNWLTQQHAQG